MTLRDVTKYLVGLGFLLVAADSCATNPAARGELRDRAAGYEVTVLSDGIPAPTYTHNGGTYVLGQLGARYTLRVANHSGRRVEAVMSVDGRDIIDGKPGDFRSKRGYLIPAWGHVDIDGWRISHVQAAAFRFSSVPDSYAARTGSARDVGVIGVAIFPEQYIPPRPVYRRPYDVAPPPPWARNDDAESTRGGAGAPKAEEAAPSSPAPSPAPAPATPHASSGAIEDSLGSSRSAKDRSSRPGLGTEYGEAVASNIYEVDFVRANASRPAMLLGLRYNDRAGLLALGIPVDHPYPTACDTDQAMRATAQPFPASDRRFAAPPPGWFRTCDWQ
jgi:hypothetical protein